MIRPRRAGMPALGVVLALLLAACGGSGAAAGSASSASSARSSAPPSEAALDLVSDGQLTVCTDSPYRPFEFQTKDGTFTGFDVDIVDRIAKGLDLQLQYKVTPFDAIQSGAALNARQCDLAASAMTILPERAKRLAFSDPYFDADQSLMVRTDNAGLYPTLADLAGQKIGVQASTTGAAYAKEHAPVGAEVVDYPDASALFQALQGNQIAAVLQDFPVNAFFASKNDSVMVVEQYSTGEQYGLAAQKGDSALIAAVDRQLATLRSDGTYDTIYRHWFGQAPPSSSASESGASAPSEQASG